MTITLALLAVTVSDASKSYGNVKTYGSPWMRAFTSTALRNIETINSITITDTNSGDSVGANVGGSYALTLSLERGEIPFNMGIGYSGGNGVTYNGW